jgi:AcrR family transcriptional regulator
VSPRAYDNSRRRQQAETTRTDVLRAARGLFAARGFAATTVADIAAEAGVAVQTVYARFGGKAGIIDALIELIDVDSDIPAVVRAALQESDPHEVLRLAVSVPRSVMERNGEIVAALQAASAENDAAAHAIESGRRRHDGGLAAMARRIGTLGGLADGVDVREAGVAFAALTSDEMFRQLRDRHGWDWKTSEAWMVATLAKAYLRPPVPATTTLDASG